jgi:hypothetical protein
MQPTNYLTFLENLFSPTVYTEVLSATAVKGKSGHTVGKAFNDYEVNFTHFGKLYNHASVNAYRVMQAIERGAALESATSN